MPTSRATRRNYLSVELERIDLERGERRVLRNVAWRIQPGERWVLIGGNGAGKTQLLKLVAGSVWPLPTGRERRRYRWRGERFDTPAGVLEEIAYVGAERQDRYERYDWNFTVREVVGTGLTRTDIPMGPLSAAQLKRVAALLERLDISSLAEQRFLTLSYGEKRLTLIARALASNPKLLLLDEVANGLDTKNHARLMHWLASTERSALPWIFATHRIADVPDCATHCLALDAGRVRKAGRATAAEIRKALARAERGGKAPLQNAPARNPRKPRRKLVVGLEHADVYTEDKQLLHGIDMTVMSGDCWVVHGPNGSGKTSLLRTIYGDHSVADTGSITRQGISPGVPLEQFKLRTALVAPHLQSVHLPQASVLEVVASGRYASIGLNEALTAEDRKAARAALVRFGMEHAVDRTIGELSYGQMRRVLFARAWVQEPRLALLDEPFAGLDPRTRADLSRRLDEWLMEGGACVMATHHAEEWPSRTSHVLELVNGRAVSSRELRED
jgi:molybdate transport system ATP-binding protein